MNCLVSHYILQFTTHKSNFDLICAIHDKNDLSKLRLNTIPVKPIFKFSSQISLIILSIRLFTLHRLLLVSSHLAFFLRVTFIDYPRNPIVLHPKTWADHLNSLSYCKYLIPSCFLITSLHVTSRFVFSLKHLTFLIVDLHFFFGGIHTPLLTNLYSFSSHRCFYFFWYLFLSPKYISQYT